MFDLLDGVHGGDANASGVYAEGITSSLLAAERTYLAWIRTIISIVGFGLVLARFFSPTNTIGSLVASSTTGVCAALLTMCTQRYYRIVWLLDNKKFEPDRITPIVVTTLMGLLILLLLVGGVHSRLVELGCLERMASDGLLSRGDNTGKGREDEHSIQSPRPRGVVQSWPGETGENSSNQPLLAVASALAADAVL